MRIALATPDENGHVEGLLGYDNGVNNDFAPIVSGTTITTTQLYYGSGDPGVADSLADYWRVAQANSLLYYAPGTHTSDYTNNGFPADAFSFQSLPTALQQEGLQEAVQAGITDPQLQQAAALDFIVTGNPDIVTGGANVQQQGITTTDSSETGAVVTPALGVSANNAALVEPASGRLFDASPTLIEYVPDCASQALADDDHEARSWMFSGKDTVVLCPGVRFTRWNPLSCSGGSWLAAGSPTYICATSAPVTDPVLVIVAVTVACPLALNAPTLRLENENFVYDSPYPNGNIGVMFWDWYQR